MQERGIGDGTLQIPALGRPMQLGMLYDCRNDSLIPGITLWDPQVLQDDRHVSSKPNTQFKIISSDTINDKSSALNVQASLKASFMSGLVEVGGSAEYMNNKKTSSRKSRLTLQYKTTTRFEQLTMKQLGRDNVQHSYVFDQGTATHVVTGILYGAQAFFVFERSRSQEENEQDIKGHMDIMIKKIPSFSIEGKGSLDLNDKEKNECNKLECTFHGDFALPSNPSSYEEAMEIYQQLPSMLGENGEHAVPLEVWLYPLTLLDSTAGKLVREISIHAISRVQDILEGLNDQMIRSNDLKVDSICTDFTMIAEKLELFDKHVQNYELTFQRELAHVLPTIRGGGGEEQMLIDIALKNEQSPFSLDQLKHWLDLREREISILRAYMKNLFADFKLIPSKQKLYEMKVDLSVEHLVCYSFSSVAQEDKFLEDLDGYLRSDTQEWNTVKEDWFDNEDTLVKMRHSAKQFKEFAEANKETKGTFFAVMGLDDGDTGTRGEGGSVFLYSHSKLKMKCFDPPGAPGKPTPNRDLEDATSLTWAEPQRGLTHVQCYRVRYRKKSPTGCDWGELKTEGRVNRTIVPNLNPGATYEFSVAAVCTAGVGKESDVSEVSEVVL